MTGAVTIGRYESMIVFLLRFTEPGGVTVPGREVLADQRRVQVLLDTDPHGRPQLPGTSLAGALREMVRERRGETHADQLFGPPPGRGADVEPKASRIWVLGSRLRDPDSVAPEIRSGIKIDRERGAAARQMLRADQILPAGTSFEVFLRWEDAAPDELADFAGLLASWAPLIGSGVTRGRGRCLTDEVRYGNLRLDDPDDLLVWLTVSGPDLARSVAVRQVPCTPDSASQPVLDVTATVKGPWRIGSGIKPVRGTREPIPQFQSGGRFVVPGSALKGIFRSRAEFILRSIGCGPEPCLEQQCRECWPCRVFGHGGGQDPDAASVGRRAVIRFADAVITTQGETERTHIAIDRFTGGVLPGALYTVKVLEAGEFGIRCEAAGAVGEDLLTEIRAVFRLIIEDLNDGIIGIGAATARGYGSVSVTLTDSGLPSAEEAQRTLARMQGGAS